MRALGRLGLLDPRRNGAIVATLLVLSVLILTSQPAAAVHTDGVFELDGDADNDATAGDDWATVGSSLTATASSFVHDGDAPIDTSYLHLGSSKDIHPLSGWTRTAIDEAPDKDEILDGFSAAYFDTNGQLRLYFGADRYANNGDSAIGFWFLQNTVTLGPNGLIGEHAVGDILVVADFTTGGAINTILAYKWVGPGGTADSLELVATGADCRTVAGTHAFCALVNDTSVPSPWSYTPKAGPSGAFPSGSFLEGGINLDALNLGVDCISSFMVTSRTSTEVEARLKDIVVGQLDTCKAPGIQTDSVPTGNVDAGTAVKDIATFTNPHPGATFPVTGTADFYLCQPAAVTAGGCETGGTLISNDVAIVNGSAESATTTNTNTLGKYCWRVEYTPPAGSNQFKAGSHTNTTTECFTVVPPQLTITKTAGAAKVTAGDPISFTIAVTNVGLGTAKNVTLSDPLPTGTGVTWSESPNITACSIAGSPQVLTCSFGNLAASGGSASVTVTSPTTKDSCKTYTNVATIGASNHANVSDGAETTVDCPQIDIDKTPDAAQVVAGSPIGFTITVTNLGDGEARGVHLTDTLPANAGLVWTIDGGTGSGHCSIATSTLTCDFPNMAKNASFTVHISSPTTTATCGTVDNTATVTTTNDGQDSDSGSVLVNCPNITVTLDKTNDADGNGTFTDAEVAPSAGADVPFKFVITNTSPVAVTITSIKDTFGGVTVDICDGDPGEGPDLIGTVLAATNGTVTCEFTRTGYSPEAGGAKVNTGRVDVAFGGLTAFDEDNSTVATPGPIEMTVDKTNDANGNGEFNDDETAPTAGSDVEFQLVITNNSDFTVTVTTITDAFGGPPIDITDCLLANGANAIGQELAANGGSVTCTFTLEAYSPPGGQDLEDTVVVTVVDELDREGSDSDTSIVRTPVALALTVDKTNNANGDATFTDNETAPSAGAAVPFKLVITNTAAIPVTITIITDTFGGQTITITSCLTDGGQNVIGTELAANGGTVTCTFTLPNYSPPAGQSLVDTIEVTVTASDGRTISDTDTSTVNTPTPTPPPPGPQINLLVAKADDPDPIVLGTGDVTYTIQVTNQGPSTATGVVATDTVPTALTLKSASASQGTCATAANVVTCQLGTLAPGASATLTIVVTPTAVGTFTDVVVVAGNEPETSTTDNRDEEPTTVIAVDLAIDKDDAGATFTVGDQGTYTLTVTNVGTAPTTGAVTVTDTLVTGLTFVSATGDNWTCSAVGQAITCAYDGGVLAPGTSAPPITVIVAVGNNTENPVPNTGVVSTPNDVNALNDQDSEETPLVAVLTGVIERPPEPAPAAAPAPAALPRTGMELTLLIWLGAALATFGSALRLGASRQRRRLLRR